MARKNYTREEIEEVYRKLEIHDSGAKDEDLLDRLASREKGKGISIRHTNSSAKNSY